MRTRTVAVVVIALVVGIAVGLLVDRGDAPPESQTTGSPGPASAGQKGGQDQKGPYTVVENWPKPISQLGGHDEWAWGAV